MILNNFKKMFKKALKLGLTKEEYKDGKRTNNFMIN